MATHFTAFNPIKAKYSFHSSSCLWWKLLVGEEGLIGYSWYRQNRVQVEARGELILKMWGICMVARSQDGQTLRHLWGCLPISFLRLVRGDPGSKVGCILARLPKCVGFVLMSALF